MITTTPQILTDVFEGYQNNFNRAHSFILSNITQLVTVLVANKIIQHQYHRSLMLLIA